MRKIYLALLSMMTGILTGGDFIADSGTKLQIVLPEKLPHEAMRRHLVTAAERLASALEAAFGKTVPVVVECAAAANRKTIYIGSTAKARSLGLKPADGFNYCIAAGDDYVCIAGTDLARLSKVYHPQRAAQEEFILGSVRGVVEFCEKFLDTRFLWPGETGTDYVKLSQFRVPAGVIRSRPPRFKLAAGSYPSYLDICYDYALGWFGRGSWQVFGGHSIRNLGSEKLFKAHPEYFALIKGRRMKGSFSHYCLSNPGVLNLYAEIIRKCLDDGAEVYEVGMDDCYQPCECKKCRAMHPDPGERIWIFYRKLAEKIAASHPEKTLLLLSYDKTVRPPVSFDTFPGNVKIELCQFDQALFAQWKQYKGVTGISVYIYNWGCFLIPGFTPKRTPEYIADQMKLLTENNVQGIYRCGFGENYGLEGVLYYLHGKLMLDPELNAEKTVDEFIGRAFHEAAPPMKEFFRKMHTQLAYFTRLYGEFAGPNQNLQQDFRKKRLLTSDPREVIQLLWPASQLRMLERDLKAAERAAVDEKVKRRLALVRTEFNYAKLLSQSLRAYSAYLDQPDQEGFRKVEKIVKARRKFLDSLCDAKGRIKSFPGWPEMQIFSSSAQFPSLGPNRGVLEVNGKLEAPIAGPLTWNFENYRKNNVLPDASRKSLTAKFTKVPPPNDYRAECWKSVPWGSFCQLNSAKPKTGGWFKVLYNKENLYIFMQSAVPSGRKYTSLGRNTAAGQTDSAEVFIDPEGMGRMYYHFLVNPVENSYRDGAFGLIVDPLNLLYQTYDPSWDGHWSYFTRRLQLVKGQPDHWWMMMKIPFKTLNTTMPAKGTIWNLDFARTQFEKNGDWKTVKLFLWSGPDGKFHDRSSFGELIFE